MNLNASCASPVPLQFGARFKLASKAIGHGLHASKDSAVSVVGTGSLLPSVPMTAAAGMLATDGAAPGASNHFIVDVLNFSNQQAIGQSVAQHHVSAAITSASLGGGSALGGRKSMKYLAEQADLVARVKDPSLEAEAKSSKKELSNAKAEPAKKEESKESSGTPVPSSQVPETLLDTATELVKEKPVA